MRLPSSRRPQVPSRPRALGAPQVNYSGHDFARSIVSCLAALAPAAIDDLGDDLAGIFRAVSAKTAPSNGLRPFPSDDDGAESSDDEAGLPAFTVAVRRPGLDGYTWTV